MRVPKTWEEASEAYRAGKLCVRVRSSGKGRHGLLIPTVASPEDPTLPAGTFNFDGRIGTVTTRGVSELTSRLSSLAIRD